MWTCIQYPEVWRTAVVFTHADHLPGRYWTTLAGLPQKAPLTDGAATEALAAGLSAFFRETQGRGHHCSAEHHERADGQDYFFVYVEDYADCYVGFTDGGEFRRTVERRALELVLAYDREAGRLAMYAKGSRKVNELLQQIFCRAILGREPLLEDRATRPYELNPPQGSHVCVVYRSGGRH